MGSEMCIRDRRTASCSAARNAGINGVLDSLDLFTDIAGNARVLEDLVDMGAYEQASDFVSLNGFVQTGCPDESSATVTIDTAEAQVPLAITWENETAVGEGLSDLSPGTYTITIADALGCSDTLTQVIPTIPLIDAVAVSYTHLTLPTIYSV